MTLSTDFFVSTLGNRGSKSSDLSHSELRENSPKISKCSFDDLTLIFANRSQCTVNLNTQKGKELLVELMRQVSGSFAFRFRFQL